MIEEIEMSTHRPQMRKILLLGGYGSGKTHFIGTAPKPVLLYSFDKGFDTVAMTPGVRVVSVLEGNRQKPDGWQDFRKRWQQTLKGELYTWPDGRQEAYQTIALDGIGFLGEMCMNYYQYMGQNVDKKATYTQYQQILENVSDIINDALRLVEYVICTTLIKVEKDELTGEVLSLPAMPGSIRDGIGAKFDAVFYMYADKKPNGEEVFSAKTVGGYREKAKIRLPSDIRSVIAPTLTNPNLQEILQLVETKIETVYGDRPKPPTQTVAMPKLSAPVAAQTAPSPAARPTVQVQTARAPLPARPASPIVARQRTQAVPTAVPVPAATTEAPTEAPTKGE